MQTSEINTISLGIRDEIQYKCYSSKRKYFSKSKQNKNANKENS